MTGKRLGIGFIGTGNISSAYLKAILGKDGMPGFGVLDVNGLADMKAEAASAREIQEGINEQYQGVEGESADSLLQEFTDTAIDFTETEYAAAVADEPVTASTAPIVRMVQLLIAEAVQLGASHIALRPEGGGVQMYYVIADKLVRRDCPPQRLLLAIIQRLCDLAGITYRPEGLQMGEFSVTPMQFAALAKLHDAGRVSQIELGRSTAMDPATVWGVVNRLAKQGYVAQSPAPSDGRLVMVELTDAGREATQRMKAVAAEVSRETLRAFTDEEARQLLALLSRLGD